MKQIVDHLETRQEFKEFMVANKSKVIIVKASATWCGPCKRIKNDFMRMFHALPDGAILVEIDIDEADDIAAFLKIKKVPTMMNFVNGMPMDAVATGNIDEVKMFFDKTRTHMAF